MKIGPLLLKLSSNKSVTYFWDMVYFVSSMQNRTGGRIDIIIIAWTIEVYDMNYHCNRVQYNNTAINLPIKPNWRSPVHALCMAAFALGSQRSSSASVSSCQFRCRQTTGLCIGAWSGRFRSAPRTQLKWTGRPEDLGKYTEIISQWLQTVCTRVAM